MLYFVCFVLSLLLLFWILSYGKVVDVYMIMLIVVVAIGNGGFYFLANSSNLEEAILGNTISYVIGIFAPLIVFRIVCSICRIRVPYVLYFVMESVQMVIYLSLFTIGKNGLFYKTVEYHAGSPAYLTKTYGPMHTAYLVTLFLYTLSGIVMGLISLERKTVVSRNNVITVLVVNAVLVGTYVIERVTQVKLEIMPMGYVIALFILMVPLLRLYAYSVYDNTDIFYKEIEKTGYIIFDRRLRYMGCSEYAAMLFPELSTWTIEKKIPGNGGRFNTFLRRPLMEYESGDTRADAYMGTYTYKDEIYSFEIGELSASKKKSIGYIIKVVQVTDVVKGSAE